MLEDGSIRQMQGPRYSLTVSGQIREKLKKSKCRTLRRSAIHNPCGHALRPFFVGAILLAGADTPPKVTEKGDMDENWCDSG